QLRQAQEERAQLQDDLETIRREIEFGEKSAAMFALETKEKQLAEDLRQTQKDLAARTAALQQAEQSLAGARARVGELSSNVDDVTLTSDEQRVELIALRAQVEALQGQAETLENEVRELTDVTDRLRNEAASGTQIEAAVRAELAEAESRSRAATEILRTE